jgi:hypothetical protein
MAKVKKRVLALSRWSNQLWRVITCWCISTVTWSHDLNSHMVIWYKSKGLIYVCFKRWDKDVCDPYEATPWRNHTRDTNDSRSLLSYILFNLSIGIVVLSRGIQKEGWCLPKLKPLYSKAIFWKPKISLKFYGWSWLGLRNLECSYWKAAELLKLQLSWTSAELSFFSCSWAELRLSWTFSTPTELQLQPGSRASSTGVQRGSTGVQGKFSRGFFPRPHWSIPVEPVLAAVQPVSGSPDRSDLLTGRLTVSLTTRRLNRS